MSVIIDRRLNDRNKSAVNRERFLRRYKEHIQRSVQDPLAEMLLAGEIADGSTVAITSGTNRLQFRVKGSKPKPVDGTFEVQDTADNQDAA